MEPISEKFENRLKIFGEVMDKGLVSCFFLTHSVVTRMLPVKLVNSEHANSIISVAIKDNQTNVSPAARVN